MQFPRETVGEALCRAGLGAPEDDCIFVLQGICSVLGIFSARSDFDSQVLPASLRYFWWGFTLFKKSLLSLGLLEKDMFMGVRLIPRVPPEQKC